MSLDVYLDMPEAPFEGGSGIYIRENGETREITRAEWDERFPDREPVVVPQGDSAESVFHANITHNLNRMADEAGIYKALWRPEEIGITQARQLIEPLRAGLAALNTDPERFRALNPSNGWGDYDGLVRFVARYLAACEQYPDAAVYVSR